MARSRIAIIFLGLTLCVAPSTAEPVPERVVSVHNGHNLTILVDRKQVKVRLAEIVAPELKPPLVFAPGNHWQISVFSKRRRSVTRPRIGTAAPRG